jgi:hypothetical protein
VYSYPDGYYAFTWPAASAGNHEYRTLFDGAPGYTPVVSPAVTVAALTARPTQISLLTTDATPSVHQIYTLYGTLQTDDGSKLGNQPIYLQEKISGSWQYAAGPLNTYPDGYYAFTWPAASAGNHEYRTLFDGAPGYGQVASTTVTEIVS